MGTALVVVDTHLQWRDFEYGLSVEFGICSELGSDHRKGAALVDGSWTLGGQ